MIIWRDVGAAASKNGGERRNRHSSRQGGKGKSSVGAC